MTGRKQRKDAHLWIRDPHDWYVEPVKSTEQLLTVENFPGWTHDPCCGQGNIVETMLATGYTVTGSDLIQRVAAPWHLGQADFLDGDDGLFGADNCVFNPPYYRAIGAEQACMRALEKAPGKVAAFLEARFLFGANRARRFWREHPPNRLWLLTDRPSCPPGVWLAAGNKAEGGEQSFFWAVWDAKRLPAGCLPSMGWL